VDSIFPHLGTVGYNILPDLISPNPNPDRVVALRFTRVWTRDSATR
jgi:hypothetical protein